MGNSMQTLTWAGSIIISLLIVFAAASALSAWRWKKVVTDLVALLDAGRRAPAVRRYDVAELASLPAPVQRYFRAVLTEGQPIITAVTVTQAGMFSMSATADQWKPFTATQSVTTMRAGFVWNAAIMLFPGVPVRVVDAYIAGQGTLRPSILGLYPMADMHGHGEIARGELMRWFAEAVWYPTALLPSQGVTWQAVDDQSATATLMDGPISLTLLFRFGADGLISIIHANERARMDGKTVVMTPWECTMSDYRKRDGMLVPHIGTASYVMPSGERQYYRGPNTTLSYAFAE
jgi:hypothetical protein